MWYMLRVIDDVCVCVFARARACKFTLQKEKGGGNLR
jgi:hypothetical protein